eukprot:gene6467-biopygen3679
MDKSHPGMVPRGRWGGGQHLHRKPWAAVPSRCLSRAPVRQDHPRRRRAAVRRLRRAVVRAHHALGPNRASLRLGAATPRPQSCVQAAIVTAAPEALAAGRADARGTGSQSEDPAPSGHQPVQKSPVPPDMISPAQGSGSVRPPASPFRPVQSWTEWQPLRPGSGGVRGGRRKGIERATGTEAETTAGRAPIPPSLMRRSGGNSGARGSFPSHFAEYACSPARGLCSNAQQPLQQRPASSIQSPTHAASIVSDWGWSAVAHAGCSMNPSSSAPRERAGGCGDDGGGGGGGDDDDDGDDDVDDEPLLQRTL